MYEIVTIYNDPTWTHELHGISYASDSLDGAIEKWEFLASFLRTHPEALVSDGARTTCPLCQLYWANACHGCPIAEWTGLPHCENTPHERYHDEPTLTTALMELDFLVALRAWLRTPSGETLYDLEEYGGA